MSVVSKDVWRIVRQHVIDARVELIVKDDKWNIYDKLEGVLNGGSTSLDAGSSVRRTASFSITPTKQLSNIGEKSLIWLNKQVNVRVGILDQRTRNTRMWFDMGVYLYNNSSMSYDASTNVLSIELSDFVLRLDGTINGQVGGAITTILPAYEEDPETGEPISYNTIKGAIENTLLSAGLHQYEEGVENPAYTFVIGDVGEYYAMPEHNINYLAYREKYPLWNMIPYDQEFSTGCTVWDIVSQLVSLYPSYDAAFDKRGIFRVNMIPTEYGEENDFNFGDYNDMVISEQVTTDLTTVKNICEVWGESMDADWYTENCVHGKVTVYRTENEQIENLYQHDGDPLYYLSLSQLVHGEVVDSKEITVRRNETAMWRLGDLVVSYNYNNTNNIFYKSWDNPITFEGVKYPANRDFLVFSASQSYGASTFEAYEVEETNSYVAEVEGYPDSYRTGDRIAIKFAETNYSGQTMQINDLEPLTIIDQATKEPLEAGVLNTKHIHIFYIAKVKTEGDNYIQQFFYLGVSQAHAINVLSNGQAGLPVTYIDEQGISHTVYEYTKEYYEYFLNCDTVSISVVPDSPFVVQKLGNRIDVKADGEFNNITSNELALERAEYENWKNCRLTDNITITTKLMPFVEPYMKIDYKKHGERELKDYIVQSVSHDFDNGTTSIQMNTFYSLYKRQPGELYRMTYEYMAGFTNEDLGGDEDAQNVDNGLGYYEGEEETINPMTPTQLPTPFESLGDPVIYSIEPTY